MEQTEQPLRWARGLSAGAASAIVMMALVDVFCLMGVTPFSYEIYLGSLILDASYGTHLWTVGFLANIVLGGVFGIVYAYCFENFRRASNARLGIFLGLGHAVLAAIAIFPFFSAIREFMGVERYASFGLFGAGLDAATPILLLFSHLVFGATMGTFYGPTGRARVRSRYYEPGEVLPIGHPDAISASEDAEDRAAV